MDLSFGSEYDGFREEVKTFLKNNHDKAPSGRVIGESQAAQQSLDWQKLLIENGYTCRTIPKEYGGYGAEPNIIESRIIAEEFASAKVSQGLGGQGISMLTPTLLEMGTEEQRQQFIRPTIYGEMSWCQGYSEPGAGSDLASLTTAAVLDGDEWVVNGQKIWTSRAEYSDLMILMCRTTPKDQVQKKTDGLSVLLVDMRQAGDGTLTIRPIRTMMNHATTEIFFDDMQVPAENLIGEEGRGFRYILSGMNAERILIAAECIGDAKWFIQKASAYAAERSVFGRPIGQNQGIQFPIARAYAQMRSAELVLREAIRLYDAGENPGEEANLAKMLCAEASWAAAEMCVQTHGGFGFAEEYDVERKFREARLYQVAPISTNLILSYVGEHVLGLPRSY